MKVVIRKPDLDTCLTALILGVGPTDVVAVRPAGASAEELADPGMLCIEAGGSGQTALGNFDHHDTGFYLPPACVQAWESVGGGTPGLERLVRYVAQVDEARSDTAVPFPSLSNIFSGMLIEEREPLRQFCRGVSLLREFLELGLDPFAPVPGIPTWQPYVAAKERNQLLVEKALEGARYFETSGGLKAGYCESRAPGGLGALYAQGCSVVIMHNPLYGDPPVCKYTIASHEISVVALLEALNVCESGWGGRATIIGSPPAGSVLTPDEIIALVRKHL